MSEKEYELDSFDRCSSCIHFKSYYFDEYDSDCWCEIFDELKDGYCEKFKCKSKRFSLSEENEQLRKNFDDLVKWTSEIAERNVILNEKIAKVQKENNELNRINMKLNGDYVRLYCFVKRLKLSKDDLKRFEKVIGDYNDDI